MDKKILLLYLFAIVYTVSPIDLLPGPIDDFVLDLATVGISVFMQMAKDKVNKAAQDVSPGTTKESIDSVVDSTEQVLKSKLKKQNNGKSDSDSKKLSAF